MGIKTRDYKIGPGSWANSWADTDLHEVGRRHGHRLKDVHSVGGGDVDGCPAIDAEVEVEGGGLVEAVVVAVVEGGPDEVPAASRSV